MKGGVLFRLAGSVGASGALAASLMFVGAGAALAHDSTVYVSPNGSMSAEGDSCSTAQYSSINAAIAAAPNGGTVKVCKGTYAESVWVNKPLNLEGQHAVVNATGQDVGIKITSSWVEVEGFTVWGATGEGILAQGTPMQITLGGMPVTTGTPVTHVRIERNEVKGNDRGSFAPGSTYPECTAQGEVPGDCGEGIHLWSAAWSVVKNNKVHDNAGGILLTDEFGPNHDNLVQANVVYHNTLDCGITIPSHNVGLNPFTGALLPTIGGVYHNTIRGNTVFDNGNAGEGAGILLASPAPVTAVYDNLVIGNAIWGNEMAGVTMHTHAPGAYLNDNRIKYNWIGRNNVGGDPDAGVMQTTGVLVNSPLSPMRVTIEDNTIFNDHFGIWLSANVTASKVWDNTFFNVVVKVQQ